MNLSLFFPAFALFASGLFLVAAEVPKLLPFQGRLTDRNGTAVADGERVVQFKIYDAPVGGSAVWNGEVQKLTVNAGLVNTVLGSKSSLSSVDFNKSLYLELTVDANNDGQITVADPPLLPRQVILPAIFAKEAGDSRLLGGYDWSALFGTNNPTLPLPASKLADGSLPSSKLAPASVTSNQIAPKTVTAAQIADATISNGLIMDGAVDARVLAAGAVTIGKIANSAVTSEKIATNAVLNAHLAPASVSWDKQTIRTVGSINSVAGQVGISAGTAGIWNSPTPRVHTLVPGLSVTMTCTGRPIFAFLTCNPGANDSQITASRSVNNGYIYVALRRVNLVTSASTLIGELVPVNYGASNFATSPGMFQFMDVPPAGQFRYEIEARTDSSNGSSVSFAEVRLVAFEL